MRQILLFVFLILFFSFDISAKEPLPLALGEVGITPKIGALVSSDAVFRNSSGELVQFGDFLKSDRVVVLNFVYLNCPMLCGLLLNGLHDTLLESSPKYDSRYQIISVSMDSRDSVTHARDYREKYLASFSDREFDWEFLVGDDENIRKLSDSVGFHFKFLEDTGEFAHGASLIFLDGSGQISRYLYGVMFRPFDFKMAILEANDPSLNSPIDQGLLFCYNYNSEAEGYSLQAFRLMQAASILTVLFIVIMVTIFRLQERRRNGR